MERSALLLHELYRVGKPGSRVSIAFAQQEFLQQLFGFELYDNSKNTPLGRSQPVTITFSQNEIVKSKAGKMASRE